LWAMYPLRAQLSPRVRVFVEWVSRLYEGRFGALAPAGVTPLRA